MDDLKPVEVSPESLPARIETDGKSFDLVPRNLTEAMEFAKLIAKTSLVPKSASCRATSPTPSAMP